MGKFITFSAQYLCSSFPPDTKILRPRITFRVKTTDFESQYNIYYRTCTDGSFVLEEVDLTVSYAPVAGI